jgi:Na+/H+ antiporter NhaA
MTRTNPNEDSLSIDPAARSVGRSDRTAAVRTYLATEAGSAVVLIAAALAALVWANLPGGASYESFWTTRLALDVGDWRFALDLRHWVNDGLMALFFFVVGLEIRRELDMGELRERRRIAVPVIAAVGGMLLPAIIYTLINAGGSGADGWAMVMATDTALALGVLALAGRRAPARLRTFLLTFVIVDDIVSISVIAIFYAGDLHWMPLGLALGLLCVAIAMHAAGLGRPGLYLLIGVPLWFATHEAGIHATIAGVALGLLTTAHTPPRVDLERATALARAFREQPTPETARVAGRSIQSALSLNERFQYSLHPWTGYLIVPIFALANAGVALNGEILTKSLTSPITIGAVLAFVLGKPLGIVGASWLASRRQLGGLPLAVGWPPLIAAGSVAGIGFTVSLLIAELAFEGDALVEAKVGILTASLLAAGLGSVIFRAIERIPDTKRGLLSGTAAPLLDLDPPVDPERDHLRGPIDAPVVLVEYGDLECPFCARAEPIVRELLQGFGDDLTFVFRHYLLTDVHPHAELAAEVTEAAAAQGAFWEMHDLLFEHQDALEVPDVLRYAEQLGLDVGRFAGDLRESRYARRVSEDASSGERSGVSGTPTFFINSRRHYGAYDVETLTEAVRAARAEYLSRVAAGRL